MASIDAPRRLPSPAGSKAWVATLALVTMAVTLAIDLSLPAHPTLAQAFGVDAGTAQLTLSMFMLGFGGAQFLVGYLSDTLGRRPVLIGGLAVFVISGLACAASSSIQMLITCRVVQGIGAGAGPVVVRAMVRDTQSGPEAARLLSTILGSMAFASMIGPIVGAQLLDAFGWHAIFLTLAGATTLLLVLSRATLVETLPPERRTPVSPGALFGNLGLFLRTPGTRLPLLVCGVTAMGQFAFIAGSPFVLTETYAVPIGQFGYYLSATAAATLLGAVAGGRVVRAGRSPATVLVLGSSLLFLGGVLMLMGTYFDSLGKAGFLMPTLVYFFGMGATIPTAMALAMAPAPQVAGSASAAIGFLSLTAGALSGYLTTRFGGSSPRAVASVLAAAGAAALLFAVSAMLLGRRHQLAPI